MSKASITRLFIGAVLALVAGLVVALATLVAALAGGLVALGGPTIVTVDGQVFVESLPWLLIASLALAGGAVAALVSWIGALFNTFGLEDKTWFVALLVLGLFSFGWVAMVAYVVAGPDSTADRDTNKGVATAGQV